MTSRLSVLHVGAEAYPYAKVGGLADVLGSLPPALADLGVDVTLMLPRYRQVDLSSLDLERIPVPSDWAVGVNYVDRGFGLLRGRMAGGAAELILLENEDLFGRWGVYNEAGGQRFPDEAERWIFYQRGCLEVCKLLGRRYDVIHAHDSHAGLVPAYLRTRYDHDGVFEGTAAVFTVHNLAYQGTYGREVAGLAGWGDDWMGAMGPFELHGSFNMMKPGIVYADEVTTVSPTYAREIQTPEQGHGLDGVLRHRAADLAGILNGIDRRVWSPQLDSLIPCRYDVGRMEGKRECKRALLGRLGLPRERESRPLLAFIGRLVRQKGCDLFPPVLEDILQHDVTFVALGTGAGEYEELMRAAERKHHDRARAWIGFHDELAHWIEAGADMLLMPSHYEPCGLNQMYSMAYGTVPVVHATGGLYDTVLEVPPGDDHGTGFRFHRYDAHEFKEAVYRALVAWEDPPRWERLVRNGMTADFSWGRSAREYLALYERVVERVRRGRGRA